MEKRKMKTSSKKAKGRLLQNKVVTKVLNMMNKYYNIGEDQIRPAIMGESGVDVKLTRKAREVFPFSIECKNQEKLSIWSALKQAENNTIEGTYPMLVFKKNRSDIYCVLKFDDFLKIYFGDKNRKV